MLHRKSWGYRKQAALMMLGGVSSDWVLPSLGQHFSDAALYLRQIAIAKLVF